MNRLTDPLNPDSRPNREVRAVFNENTIRVYQAYSQEIAEPALKAQKFLPPFKKSRMTWIKPSFTWMMYRSGWAEKPGQEYILGIDILRTGFDWALANSCLSHYDASVHSSHSHWETMLRDSPVRIQWDPERSIRLQPLPWRAIQIGLGPQAVGAYVEEWITHIEDLTPHAKRIEALVRKGDLNVARALLPLETNYALSKEVMCRIGGSSDAL